WPRVERCVKIAFWGLNIGLAMMVLLSLLPNGLLHFFFAGIVPLVWGLWLAYRDLWRRGVVIAAAR
ncbi:MAG: hypothetical protein AB7P44_15005, partial [Steroidobacteraceae bacterium]